MHDDSHVSVCELDVFEGHMWICTHVQLYKNMNSYWGFEMIYETKQRSRHKTIYVCILYVTCICISSFKKKQVASKCISLQEHLSMYSDVYYRDVLACLFNSYGNTGLQKRRQAQTCDWKLYLDICHKIYILHWIRCLSLYQDGRPVLWALDWLWWGVNWFSCQHQTRLFAK